jgi:hypothetical protein
MKNILYLILMSASLMSTSYLTAQIEAVETDKGTAKDNVTDIVIVFKMHFDIGYTNWAESVLQEYSNEMLEKTLRSIDETSSLPQK